MGIKFKTDFEKAVLLDNFEKRNWVRSDEDGWHFFWASVWVVRQMFNSDSGYRLQDHQIINHFPNHYELTRKDLMVKNIKRYKREKEKDVNASLHNATGETILDFVPITYILPSDYCLFVEEYKKDPGSLWIVKPTASAQGKGIFLITKLQQIKKWAKDKWLVTDASSVPKDQYVISKYVENPMLIGGKKFDLRVYVLVTSYRPLRAYFHQDGFARFCTAKYNLDLNDLDNQFVHLTNVAVQKQGDDYNEHHGGKWHLSNLLLYIESRNSKQAADTVFNNIKFIIVQSLRSCQNVINNDKHCFELYGFDLLLDGQLKPWLIEINASPSLSYTTPNDRHLKTELLRDVFDIVIPPEFPDGKTYREHRIAPPGELRLGGFTVIIDEVPELEEKEKQDKGNRIKPTRDTKLG